MNLAVLISFWCITGSYAEICGGDLFEEEDEDETADRRKQEAGYLSDLILGHPGSDLFNPCPGHATGMAGEAFTELINTMIVSTCILAAPCSYPRDVGGECCPKTIFDFIVVGGGTAGCVIASRLSEIADWNILLLEAGGDPPITTEVPYFHSNLIKTDIDWMHQTVRENGLFNGYMGRVNRWPRAKVLGGTSCFSQLLYIRGSARDFDNFAAVGNVGWAYSDILPYYKKSEDMRALHILSSPILASHHTRGGPLTLSRFGEKLPITAMIQDAANELGYAPNKDINGVNSLGFTAPNVGTLKNGERMNTAKAFLNPYKDRKNLFVIKCAKVTKIHICPSTKRAYGVEFYYKNEHTPRTLRASREIIISAGVIETPKLLMLSGIGPEHELKNLNIYVLKNLRVGWNLQDTVMIPGLPITIQFENNTRSPLDMLDYAYEYLTRRSGPLATIGISELVAMIDVDDDDHSDIQLQFNYAVLNESEVISDFVKNNAFDEDLSLQFHAFNSYADLILPQLLLLRPLSKGFVKLKSADPNDLPLIEAGYFEDPYDLERMLIGIRFIEHLVQTDLMRSYNATLEFLRFQGCCDLEINSDYYWACVLSHIAGTGHNQVGTCKMGPCDDPEAVVDPHLRIHGLKGLRVADASILPSAITGSVMATVVMIGEKVADMIKIQWLPEYVPTFATPSPLRRTTFISPTKFKTVFPYQIKPAPTVKR